MWVSALNAVQWERKRINGKEDSNVIVRVSYLWDMPLRYNMKLGMMQSCNAHEEHWKATTNFLLD